jgi:hypothetical protein
MEGVSGKILLATAHLPSSGLSKIRPLVIGAKINPLSYCYEGLAGLARAVATFFLGWLILSVQTFLHII